MYFLGVDIGSHKKCVRCQRFLFEGRDCELAIDRGTYIWHAHSVRPTTQPSVLRTKSLRLSGFV